MYVDAQFDQSTMADEIPLVLVYGARGVAVFFPHGFMTNPDFLLICCITKVTSACTPHGSFATELSVPIHPRKMTWCWDVAKLLRSPPHPAPRMGVKRTANNNVSVGEVAFDI